MKVLLSLLFALVFALSGHPRFVAAEAPDGNGQLGMNLELIEGGVDQLGRKFSYRGQRESNNKLILTASNGFFDKKGIVAKGQSKLPKAGDEDLIATNFGYLEWREPNHSMRWHVLVARPGKVALQVFMEATDPGSKVEISFGDQVQKVTTAKSTADKAQPWDVAFDVKKPGEYRVTISATDTRRGSIGNLHRIDLYGPAIADAHLLRVRWRPAAAHGSYDTTKVSDAKLLVFTTRSMVPISNYSPITTPFGYYGTTFDNDRKSGGGFNFSMWGKKGAEHDIKQMPHLLGVGSPEGEFSGFGHEGSGVKPRGWEPMPDRPELVVQALRVESDEEYDTYYGYYFDHPSNQWKYYASGKKWHGGRPQTHLKLGSFCEVPGPPQSERTGDVYREVRRACWAWDGDSWQRMETYLPGGSGSKGDIPVNKSWYTTAEGEYAMGCGGIRLYHHKAALVKVPADNTLPAFLTNVTIERVFSTPITYGKAQATEVSATGALVEFIVSKGSGFKGGVLYYGKKDALTFAARDLHGTERKSELSQAINEQSWQKSSEITSLALGVNRVRLTDLEPNTPYYFRILCTDEVSQIWTEKTYSFQTPQSGAPVVKVAPLEASTKTSRAAAVSLGDQPFRIWTYRVGGQARTLEGRLLGVSNGRIQIERKSDGKQGTMQLDLFSSEDRAYIETLRVRE